MKNRNLMIGLIIVGVLYLMKDQVFAGFAAGMAK